MSAKSGSKGWLFDSKSFEPIFASDKIDQFSGMKWFALGEFVLRLNNYTGEALLLNRTTFELEKRLIPARETIVVPSRDGKPKSRRGRISWPVATNRGVSFITKTHRTPDGRLLYDQEIVNGSALITLSGKLVNTKGKQYLASHEETELYLDLEEFLFIWSKQP